MKLYNGEIDFDDPKDDDDTEEEKYDFELIEEGSEIDESDEEDEEYTQELLKEFERAEKKLNDQSQNSHNDYAWKLYSDNSNNYKS